MMSFRRLIQWLLPWPDKDQRKKDIESARGERTRSREALRHAKTIEFEIKSMVEQNHFAEKIVEHLVSRQQEK